MTDSMIPQLTEEGSLLPCNEERDESGPVVQ